MSCRVISNCEDDMACFYCSTTMLAFGPVMQNEEEANDFLKWLPVDPRRYPDSELIAKYWEFRVKKSKNEQEAK